MKTTGREHPQNVLLSLAVLCLTLALGHAASFYSTADPQVTLDEDSTLDDDDDDAPVLDDGDTTLDDDDDGDTPPVDDGDTPPVDGGDDTPPVDDGDTTQDDDDSSLVDAQRDCVDPYDNTDHAQGSQWESADCEICECTEEGVKCRRRYGDEFPDVPGCTGVVDPKTCAIEYYAADDPSLPCLAKHKSARVLSPIDE